MKWTKLGAKLVGQSLGQAGTVLSQSCPTAGTEALWSIKNWAQRVSCSAQLAKRQFCQLNQRLALICSLLRYVWTFYEDQRSEYGFPGLLDKGRVGLKPAYEKASDASLLIRPLSARMPLLALLGALLAPVNASADQWSKSGSFDLEETAQIRKTLAAEPAPEPGPWRASGRADQWVSLDAFERSIPGKLPPAPSTFKLPSGTEVEKLFALIAFAEAPRGRYDAINHGAKTLPNKKPSQMTLAEIYTWIEETPGQPHAIGNFQIIPSTLLNLQKRLGLPDATLFDVGTQNRMAALLLSDAGHQKLSAGEISLAKYQDNLAKIWAGLPLETGKSAYHGYAGNRATITRAFFDQQMVAIFGGAPKVLARADAPGDPVTNEQVWRDLGK